jgi:hypothetical protein
MKNEPPDICIFDLPYLCDRDRPVFPSQYDNPEHPKTKDGDDDQGQSDGRHPLLDTTIFGDKVIGLRHWIDSGKYRRRYGWGYYRSKEETKEETGEEDK